MRNKIILLIFLAFAIISINFISADIATTVVVNTAPNYSLMARFFYPGETLDYLEGIYTTSDANGVAILTFDLAEDQYEMALWLKDPDTGNYDLRYKRYDEIFNSGQDFTINFYPEWYHIDDYADIDIVQPNVTTETATQNTSEIYNQTVNETIPADTNMQQNNESSKRERVTALSISDGQISVTPKFFYYVGGIIILTAIVFFSFRYRRYLKNNPKQPKEIRTVKLSELQQQQREIQRENSGSLIKEQEEKIQQARNMIREAEEELKRARNPSEDRIEAAKRKLIEDEKELMRLRREARGY